MKYILIFLISFNLYAKCEINFSKAKLISLQKVPTWDAGLNKTVAKEIVFDKLMPPYPDLTKIKIPISNCNELKLNKLMIFQKTGEIILSNEFDHKEHGENSKIAKWSIKAAANLNPKIAVEDNHIILNNIPIDKYMDLKNNKHVFKLRFDLYFENLKERYEESFEINAPLSH